MLTGSLVALVTPMSNDGAVDFAALQRLVEFHIENGTAGIVAVGTTGESATLSVEEHIAVVKAVVDYAKGRVKVIAGAGGNATSEAIELGRLSAEVGADMVLSVVPYYNKPTQEGIYQHFKAIADASPLPVILYNVPGRTVADMSNDTALRLAAHPNIVGLKDATGDIGRACDLALRAPEGFALYSGDDATGMAFMLCGGHGVISVTANIAPKQMSELCAAATSGDARKARSINDKLQGLHKQLFVEPNPIPAKWALERMQRIPAGIRLPLTPLSAVSRPLVEAALKQAEVI
ncbi:4-hydroxy-tetrahydrodipicolinate synthase [Chromobacterium violaceum]|uniref:4-hydroxy-tetrahydrodipicolinate synthase n=1 Tax=Chromobacterium violaceum (strain ATCC 12472 / DSM 30191 / JCM 1249 / CCUG 213 / NBRC 12614 / NCIMB 9131 / NCTC 9757 / MK) TaxID=243365 RepID=Q7NS49_CHRVO|nr:4-hydroxy-tetrahydrodipicolinate synthase [Chromobacterium violaceum]AAQ61240.1 dihydrodipicolinate synthase [Chromobacterium violaceum ATCC 12472]ATP29861.1 4-hydroxy-tetrahydrodipicolinate synthase [Chromobacterium violaceum]ATP33767.1 4-hydroxy-tetrahydrodipicolinate synthase [Chromobacterium violaceum]MBA8734481.1 4-hydroxy-tetrahydrodipicolinate synthase [Chromobacterium violaceum]MCD0491182.1 4-hydroxy-tetrahydrodipicolinate synthase [Chromobacterium violaceum]